MRRLITYLFLLVYISVFITVFPLPSPAGNDTLNNPHMQNIRVGIDDQFPPYCFRDEQGNLQGICIDQWQAWEKQTGIKVVLQGMPRKSLLNMAQQGKFDVVDAILFSDSLGKDFNFLKPFTKIEIPVFYCENIKIKDVKSLQNYTVAVREGDPCLDELSKDGVKIKQFDSYKSIISSAGTYESEVFAMDQQSALYYINNGQLEERFNYTHPIYCGGFCRAARKDNPILSSTVQQGFDNIPQSEYQRINTKWAVTSYMDSEMRNYIFAGIGSGILVIIMLLAWNYTLKRKVQQKTLKMAAAIDALVISEKKYKDLVLNLGIGVAVFTPEGNITIRNQTYLDLLGINIEATAGVELHQSWHFVYEDGKEMSSEEFPVTRVIANRCPVEDLTMGIKRDHHENITWVKATAFPEIGEEGSLQQVIMTMVNITNIKQAEDMLFQFSIHDSLTGLYNRAYFKSLNESISTGQLPACGLVICDLDGLKLINDTMGHSSGDDYLLAAAKILKTSFRDEDIVSRIGGDEFAIIMPGITEFELVQRLAILKHNLEEYNSGSQSIQLSISSGYSFKTGNNIKIDGMFNEADNNMYKEKLYRRQIAQVDIIQALNILLKELELKRNLEINLEPAQIEQLIQILKDYESNHV